VTEEYRQKQIAGVVKIGFFLNELFIFVYLVSQSCIPDLARVAMPAEEVFARWWLNYTTWSGLPIAPFSENKVREIFTRSRAQTFVTRLLLRKVENCFLERLRNEITINFCGHEFLLGNFLRITIF